MTSLEAKIDAGFAELRAALQDKLSSWAFTLWALAQIECMTVLASGVSGLVL